jgi:glycosyltransferase involved in cell wall biosynthesis
MAVLSQSLPRDSYELIVVDDGSTDQTASIARKRGARVLPRSALGLAAARNAGLQASRSDIVVFLDPDCLPRLDWLAEMIQPFGDPTVVGVQGAYASDQRELMPRLIQSECEETYRNLEAHPTTDVIRGYSAAFRRSVLVGFEGFDPSFTVGDDLELSRRLARNGLRLIFNGRARVYHRHGDSVWRYLERSLRDGLWDSLIRARHSDEADDDTQIPRALRAEVPLAGLTLVSFVLGARWRRILPLAGILAATFTTMVAPSAWRARDSGTDVALTLPGLHFLRSLALGSGMAIGRGAVASNQVSFRLAKLARLLRRIQI